MRTAALILLALAAAAAQAAAPLKGPAAKPTSVGYSYVCAGPQVVAVTIETDGPASFILVVPPFCPSDEPGAPKDPASKPAKPKT